MFSSLKNIKQLRVVLAIIFIAVAIPAFILSFYSYTQLKWEAFYVQRNNASELSDRINAQIERWVLEEEKRSFTDYRFLKVAGDQGSNYFTPSPLSSFPASVELPGTIGFFQVDSRGLLTSPILPDTIEQGLDYGVTEKDFSDREKSFQALLNILVENQLVAASSSTDSFSLPVDDVTAVNEEKTVNSESESNNNKDIARKFEEQLKKEFDGAKTRPKRYQQIEELAIDTNLEKSLIKESPIKEIKAKKADKQSAEDRASSDDTGSESTSFTSVLTSQPKEKDSEKKLVRSSRVEQSYEVAAPESSVLSQKQDVDEPFIESRPAAPVQSINNLGEKVVSDKNIDTEKNYVTVFESEIDPFKISLLDTGHIVMYRKVWKNEQRFIQGVLIDPNVFLQESIGKEFRSTQLSHQTDLVVAYNKNVLSLFSGEAFAGRDFSGNSSSSDDLSYSMSSSQSFKDLSGERLLQSNLLAPFNEMQLIFSVKNLDAGPGSRVVVWSSLVMGVVLSLGVWLMYVLGVRQLKLAQQQQDFVSAVSHELKTPLTSIRMYGELLKEGWATEEKKQEYYHYIFDESERLSRLISNVLQLARMNRGDWDVQLKSVPISSYVDNLRSKLNEQVRRAGFTLQIDVDDQADNKTMLADIDYLLQVMINLVDNAIKFSRNADNKKINIFIVTNNTNAIISIRDFGPGIDKSQLNKIFELFYRSENELTRETVGTGIGLALVTQLVEAMEGSVSVSNKNPGAEFVLSIPLAL